jgi:penicillin-binding protein 1A
MATAYGSIAADGVRHDPAYVAEIRDPDGTVIYRGSPAGTAVLEPRIARQLTEMLEGPVRSGTASRALGDFPRPAAGKTGTTNSNVDAWFVGYTAQMSAAVWVGQPTCGDNDDPACSLTQFLGDDAFGGRAPANIWRAFMEPAHVGLPVVDFVPPDAGWPSPQLVTVDGRDATLPTTTTSTTSTTVPKPRPTTTTRPPRPTTTTAPPTTTTTTSPPTTTTSTTVPGP